MNKTFLVVLILGLAISSTLIRSYDTEKPKTIIIQQSVGDWQAALDKYVRKQNLLADHQIRLEHNMLHLSDELERTNIKLAMGDKPPLNISFQECGQPNPNLEAFSKPATPFNKSHYVDIPTRLTP